MRVALVLRGVDGSFGGLYKVSHILRSCGTRKLLNSHNQQWPEWTQTV